jgi:hypothetical protein
VIPCEYGRRMLVYLNELDRSAEHGVAVDRFAREIVAF